MPPSLRPGPLLITIHPVPHHTVITHGSRAANQTTAERDLPSVPRLLLPLPIPIWVRRGRRRGRDGEEPGVQGDAAVAAGLLVRRARRRRRTRRRHGRSPSSPLSSPPPLADLRFSWALSCSRLAIRLDRIISVSPINMLICDGTYSCSWWLGKFWLNTTPLIKKTKNFG